MDTGFGRRSILLWFFGAGGMIQPTFNKLIVLEVKEVVLAPALSPRCVCFLMALNHGTMFSHVPCCQSIFLCVHFGFL